MSLGLHKCTELLVLCTVFYPRVDRSCGELAGWLLGALHNSWLTFC